MPPALSPCSRPRANLPAPTVPPFLCFFLVCSPLPRPTSHPTSVPHPQQPSSGYPQPSSASTYGGSQPGYGGGGTPSGGYGARQPAPTGYGAPQPAPGGYGAPAPAPSGYGGGYGAPQAASFGGGSQPFTGYPRAPPPMPATLPYNTVGGAAAVPMTTGGAAYGSNPRPGAVPGPVAYAQLP